MTNSNVLETITSINSFPRPQAPTWLRMLKLIFRPLDYFDEYGKRFGNFIVIGNKETPLVYVNHPEAIQKILSAPPELFESGRGNGILKYLMGDNSILLVDGNRHKRKRKLLMPPFHRQKVQTYSQLISEIITDMTKSWHSGQSLVIRSQMQKITLNIILQVVFGLRSGDRYQKLDHLLTILLEATGSPISSSILFFPFLQQDWGKWSPWGRFLNVKSQIDQLLREEIEQRRQTGNLTGDDILTMLMCTRDEAGEYLTVAELRDELITLLVAGHETTASALSWAMYWIHYLPEVEKNLRSELSILDDNPSTQAIINLPYLDAVCRETLRIYPVAMTTFPRILTSSMEIMGYDFPAKTTLLPCIYLVHHREDLYPEANQFKPERFLSKSFSNAEFFPFGGGNRRCIGSELAMLEMKLVLATTLSKFKFRLANHRQVKPVRRGLTIAPPNNLKVLVEDRIEDI